MKNWFWIALLSIGVLSSDAIAQGSKDDWVRKQAEKEFKDSVNTRLKALEASMKPHDAEKSSDKAWHDFIKFSGDFRFRYEEIDPEGKNNKRRRFRLRARLNAKAKVNDEINVGIRIVSGSDDPVSTNQTLDGGFSTKGLYLDRAYAEYKPEAMDGLKVTAGKFAPPVYKPSKADLHWDGDLNMEGAAVQYKCGNDDLTFTLNGGFMFAEERSSSADTTLAMVQGVVDLNLGNPRLKAGAAYYNWNNIQDRPFLYDSTSSFGNTAGAGGGYAREYEPMEVFVELTGLNLAGMPISLWGMHLNNTATESLDNAWQAGININKAKKAGDWQAQYSYRSIQADAAVGAFVDSDSGGGGTDHKGHKVKGKVKLGKNWDFGATYFNDEVGISGTATDYQRLQLDLVFKF